MNETIINFLSEAVEKFGDKPFLYESRTNFVYESLTFREVQKKAKQYKTRVGIANPCDALHKICTFKEHIRKDRGYLCQLEILIWK